MSFIRWLDDSLDGAMSAYEMLDRSGNQSDGCDHIRAAGWLGYMTSVSSR